MVSRSGTDFLKRYATPNDIVAKARGIEGVEGALVTLPDGLLVAHNVPPSVNGETLAAFVPQAFARLGQSAREFRLGDLADLSFTAGQTPWRIFKVGAIFFAVFGVSGGTLPHEPLARLAAELDRKKQII
jgi:predicted regulator of Ras-like GTPase activity (Roadblock/LC7/MglB family)